MGKGREKALEQRVKSLTEVVGALGQAVDVLLREQQALSERVVAAVSSSERALTGELRALDTRVAAVADDARLVRLLRDQLDGVAMDVDRVRQLALRSATILAEVDAGTRPQVVQVTSAPPPSPVPHSPTASDRIRRWSDVARQVGGEVRARRSRRS